MVEFFYVFLGGGIGSLFRYLISLLFFNFSFPIATLLANILSCLILGLVVFFMEKYSLCNNMRLFLLVGICGGLSTFSTFSYETINLFREGYVNYAILNIVFSMLFCFTVLYFLIKKL